jgi:hypothetical protein
MYKYDEAIMTAQDLHSRVKAHNDGRGAAHMFKCSVPFDARAETPECFLYGVSIVRLTA